MRGKANKKSSLCYRCKNSRPSRCRWMADLIPVWREAHKKEVRYSGRQGSYQVDHVIVVTKCDHFVEMEK